MKGHIRAIVDPTDRTIRLQFADDETLASWASIFTELAKPNLADVSVYEISIAVQNGSVEVTHVVTPNDDSSSGVSP